MAVAEPMPESRLTDIQAKIKRAWTEIGEVCAEGPAKRFRMSIPSNLDRDTDLIVSAALEGAEELLAEVERLDSELKIAFGPSVYFDIQKVLDKALGTGEADGACAGVVGDVTLLAERMQAAEAEVGRLRQAMHDLYARWLQRAADNGDDYNRSANKYVNGKAVAFDAAAEEIRMLIGEEVRADV